jgi:hypothetical protein
MDVVMKNTSPSLVQLNVNDSFILDDFNVRYTVKSPLATFGSVRPGDGRVLLFDCDPPADRATEFRLILNVAHDGTGSNCEFHFTRDEILTSSTDPSSKSSGSGSGSTELLGAARDLKQVLTALQKYHEKFGSFPKPEEGGVSWRVTILPFLDEKAPPAGTKWNDPLFVKKRPKVYATGKNVSDPSYTSWRVFVGNGAAFEMDQQLNLDAFPDGSSNTILVVEAGVAAFWSKPDELHYDSAKPLPKLGGRFKEGFLAGMADGTVRLIPASTDEKTIRALITRNGAETVDPLPGRVIDTDGGSGSASGSK